MHRGIHVRRIGVKAGPHDPADFAMRIHTLTEKLYARAQDEITLHPLPYVMKLVSARPHICAGPSNFVTLLRGIIDNCTGFGGTTDIFMVFELTDGLLLAEGKRREHRNEQD